MGPIAPPPLRGDRDRKCYVDQNEATDTRCDDAYVGATQVVVV